MQRVGLLGGTFDPVHCGHLRAAVEVAAALGLDAVRLLPCRVSPMRTEPAAALEHRRAMLEAAVAGEDDLSVDGRELERPGPSYTADTLAELAAESPATRWYFILGGDALATFDCWDRWPAILEHAHLVATQRPGAPPTPPPALRDRWVEHADALEAEAAGRLWIQAITQLDISASAIRAQAACGGDLRFLLPAAVRRYLETHRLYDA